MPKLLIFAPCEKVIIDQATNTLSLITVLQEIRYKAPPNVPLPTNAPLGLAMQWSVLTLWRQEEPDDAGVQFEQRFVLADATNILLENRMAWTFSAPTHRIIARVSGFPASANRKLSLSLFYRAVGAMDWIPSSSFPIEVLREVLG
jgi:hypothetical protein